MTRTSSSASLTSRGYTAVETAASSQLREPSKVVSHLHNVRSGQMGKVAPSADVTLFAPNGLSIGSSRQVLSSMWRDRKAEPVSI
jgi:hypothetical protein